ncbi:MAG: hypothetical protein ACM3ZQ_04915 [Bacillota bacterium]
MAAKSRLVAFLLSILPGMPQLYLGRTMAGMLLLLPSIILYIAGPLLVIVNYGIQEAFFCILGLVVLWLISNIHAQAVFPQQPLPNAANESSQVAMHPHGLHRETFIMTSLIPGGGQMYMGEVARGLPLLIAFFGWLTFTAYLAINLAGGFIVLWGLLPVIWAYSLFDALQGWRRSLQGSTEPRPSLFEELEANTQPRRKNRALAVALSAIPGLGHLYLGEMGVGLALMAGFLLLLSLNNLAYINLGFVIVPLLWFYSVFDMLAQVPQLSSGESEGRQRDPIAGQRWLGIITLGSGLLILVERLVLPFLSARWVSQLQPLLLAIILMGVGARLLLGNRLSIRSAKTSHSAERGDNA